LQGKRFRMEGGRRKKKIPKSEGGFLVPPIEGPLQDNGTYALGGAGPHPKTQKSVKALKGGAQTFSAWKTFPRGGALSQKKTSSASKSAIKRSLRFWTIGGCGGSVEKLAAIIVSLPQNEHRQEKARGKGTPKVKQQTETPVVKLGGQGKRKILSEGVAKAPNRGKKIEHLTVCSWRRK